MTGTRLETTSRLGRLTTAALITGLAGTAAASRLAPPPSGGAAADQLRENEHLAREVSRLARLHKQAEDTALASVAARIDAVVGDIDRAASAHDLGAVAAMVVAGGCPVDGDRARFFIELDSIDFMAGEFVFDIASDRGFVMPFSFASGTSRADLITAINSLGQSIGAEAIISASNADRVEVRSLRSDGDAMVTVLHRQGFGGRTFQAAAGGPSPNLIKDRGSNPVTTAALLENP